MTNNNSRFTVITNNELVNKENEIEKLHTNPISTGYANPYFEKLVKFANGNRKRFTVEDLLR